MPASQSQAVSPPPTKRSRAESPADIDGAEPPAKRHAGSSRSGTPRRSPSGPVAAIVPVSPANRSRSLSPDEAEPHAGSSFSGNLRRSPSADLAAIVPVSPATRSRSLSPAEGEPRAGSSLSETSRRSPVAALVPVSPAKRSRSESLDYSDAEPPSKRHAGSSSSGSPRRSPSPDAVATSAHIKAPLPIMRVPPEILAHIFELVLPPADVLCPTSHPDSRKLNPFWQKSVLAKKTIVSVCRAWYNVGLPFLYRHIALSNTRQIDALYRTLALQPELGARVRGITFISSLDVELFCEETAHEDMARIFALCPQLTRVNDLPPRLDPRRDSWAHEHPHPYPAIPATVTALRLGPHRSRAYVHETLRQSCARLEELWLDIDTDPAFDALALAFPRLHTLYLTCASQPTDALARWDMPRLRRLTFRPAARVYQAPGMYKEQKRILALHGGALEYLALPHRHPDPYHPPDLGPVLALCPAVKHLVVPVGYKVSLRHAHPAVEWLDVWTGAVGSDEHRPGEPERLHDASRAAAAKAHFPALVGTRTLPRALRPFFTDLARALGPHVRGGWRWNPVPGLTVTQEDRGEICHVAWADKETGHCPARRRHG
ncbi:hypothetical protein FB451DRAFT_1557018 [Mycena latifolia]|nr:hypothetical protein FB451DRAFT_1557018 [Mycena latifolia]